MKKLSFKTTLFIAIMALFMTSCGKDEGGAVSEEPQFPVPTDAEGVLVGIRTYSTAGVGDFMVDVLFGTGVAVFPGSSGFVNAGDVTLNDEELDRMSNNSYAYTGGGITNPTGIDLSTGSSWEVSGGGGVPAFTDSYNTYPSKPNITSGSTINRADGYNFTWDAITNADSIILSILTGGDDKSISVTVAGNTTSRNFTADELSKLGKTDFGIIQLAAYTMISKDISGSKIYFINQATTSKVPAKVN